MEFLIKELIFKTSDIELDAHKLLPVWQNSGISLFLSVLVVKQDFLPFRQFYASFRYHSPFSSGWFPAPLFCSSWDKIPRQKHCKGEKVYLGIQFQREHQGSLLYSVGSREHAPSPIYLKQAAGIFPFPSPEASEANQALTLQCHMQGGTLPSSQRGQASVVFPGVVLGGHTASNLQFPTSAEFL